MMVSLLLTTMALVALPAPAPPIRRNTSWTVVGSAEWSADAPLGPTCSSDGELAVPASKSRPASLTPSTSATFIAVTPLSGTSVAKPQPEHDGVGAGRR